MGVLATHTPVRRMSVDVCVLRQVLSAVHVRKLSSASSLYAVSSVSWCMWVEWSQSARHVLRSTRACLGERENCGITDCWPANEGMKAYERRRRWCIAMNQSRPQIIPSCAAFCSISAAPVVFDDALTHSLARAQVPVRADVLAAHVHLREADSKRSSTDTCR